MQNNFLPKWKWRGGEETAMEKFKTTIIGSWHCRLYKLQLDGGEKRRNSAKSKWQGRLAARKKKELLLADLTG